MNAAPSPSEGLGKGIKTHPTDQQAATGLLQVRRKGHTYSPYSVVLFLSYCLAVLGFISFHTHNQLACLLPQNNQNKMQDVRTEQLYEQLLTAFHI